MVLFLLGQFSELELQIGEFQILEILLVLLDASLQGTVKKFVVDRRETVMVFPEISLEDCKVTL